MLNNKTVAVVIPAFNEEQQIGDVIETIPDFVDRILIVNDCSKDQTANVITNYIRQDTKDYSNPAIGKTKPGNSKFDYADNVVQDLLLQEKKRLTPSEIVNDNPENNRIILINHLENAGVGAAVATGYQWCREQNIYCTAKVDGDGQMDPRELKHICEPVVYEDIDYVKGNRLIHKSSRHIVPGIRYFGNSVLSILTKIASGYWGVSDTQTAFTAISLKALQALRLDKMYKKYGYPNDILVRLNIAYCSIKEVEIKPIYNVGEKSKMKILKLIPRVSFLLLKSFFKRIFVKYFIKSFHPLFVLYNLGFILLVLSIPYIIKILAIVLRGELANPVTVLALAFLLISGFQAVLFAMWMDIQDNQRLYKF